MLCFHWEIIYIDSSVQQTKYNEKKIEFTSFPKEIFSIILNAIEVQLKVKFMSLKISKVFHP